MTSKHGLLCLFVCLALFSVVHTSLALSDEIQEEFDKLAEELNGTSLSLGTPLTEGNVRVVAAKTVNRKFKSIRMYGIDESWKLMGSVAKCMRDHIGDLATIWEGGHGKSTPPDLSPQQKEDLEYSREELLYAAATQCSATVCTDPQYGHYEWDYCREFIYEFKNNEPFALQQWAIPVLQLTLALNESELVLTYFTPEEVNKLLRNPPGEVFDTTRQGQARHATASQASCLRHQLHDLAQEWMAHQRSPGDVRVLGALHEMEWELQRDAFLSKAAQRCLVSICRDLDRDERESVCPSSSATR